MGRSSRTPSGTRGVGSVAWWPALLVLTVVASACGAGDDTRSAEATPRTTAPAATDQGPDEADDGPEQGPASPVDTDGSDEPAEPAADQPETTDDPGSGSEDDADSDAEDDAAAETETDAESEADDDAPPSAGEDDEEPADGELLTEVGPADSGETVVALQDRLAELGFAPGPADGDFGRKTRAAIQVFQELNGLPPTGRADRRTVEALATFRYDGPSLAAGDEGDEVEELQRRLAAGPFDPGPVDGVYGSSTVAAVWALEKLARVPVDGDWGPVDELAWQRLMEGTVGQPERTHDQRWVEVDLSLQLMKVYDPGDPTPILISHASSGSGIPWENEDHRGSSVTPVGDFHINRRISGWRESSLNIGRLYNPLYFNGGIAFHGATSVPLYPASHGCIRLPMHVADYLPAELPNGTPVHVLA